MLHPAGTLQVSQRAIPLDLKIDKVGSQAPSDANQFAFSVSAAVLTKTRDLQEPFAPSQFRNFDDAAKLSQPAFVPQDSGVELAGSATLATATAITRPLRYDLTVVDKESEPVRSPFFAHSRAMFTNFLAGNSAGQSKLSANFREQTRPQAGSVVVSNETFAVAHQSTNQVFHPEAAAFLSQAKAQDYISNAVASRTHRLRPRCTSFLSSRSQHEHRRGCGGHPNISLPPSRPKEGSLPPEVFCSLFLVSLRLCSTSSAVSSSSVSVAIGYGMDAMSAQMSTPMTSAPSCASRTACERPWPRATPVMNATLPSTSPTGRSVAAPTGAGNAPRRR